MRKARNPKMVQYINMPVAAPLITAAGPDSRNVPTTNVRRPPPNAIEKAPHVSSLTKT